MKTQALRWVDRRPKREKFTKYALFWPCRRYYFSSSRNSARDLLHSRVHADPARYCGLQTAGVIEQLGADEDKRRVNHRKEDLVVDSVMQSTSYRDTDWGKWHEQK